MAAEGIANLLNTTPEKVTDVSQTISVIALGLVVLIVGIAFLVAPPIGWVLIAVGAGMIGFAIWQMFKKPGK